VVRAGLARNDRAPTLLINEREGLSMPVLLWLFGMPIGLIILLMVLGVA
jgi:hypothetical protein